MKHTFLFRKSDLGRIGGALIVGFSLFLQAQETLLEQDSAPAVFPRDIVVFGKDFVLKTNEVSRDVVVIYGNAKIDGTVKGNLVTVFGSAQVNGSVENDVVVVLGSAALNSGSVIERDTIVVGGSMNLDPGARVGGDRREFVLKDVFGGLFPDMHWLGDWFKQGFLRARPLPPQLSWVWALLGVYALISFLAAVLFARPVQACVSVLEAQPTGSFFVGVLSLILFGPVVLLLMVSVAGILAVPFMVMAMLAAVFFGNLSIYCSTGQQIGRQFNLAGLRQPALSFLLGLGIFVVLYMVPILGFMVLGIATVWGLGAVLMAIFANFRHERGPAPSVATTFPTTPMPPSADAQALLPAAPPIPSSAELVSLARVGFWRRLWATILDFVLLALLIPLTGPVFILLWTAYHVTLWTWKGTTIGGIVAGIKIVRTDGQPLNFAVALVRSLSSFFSGVVLFFGFFWAGWDREKQSWHDKIAGTVVVKVPKGMALI